jgi:hypothetical protein
VPVKGDVAATIGPYQHMPDGFEPVKPGDHPRILFRKGDLPALRERLKTPFGQACFAHLGDCVGLALKYQLTGDRTFAEQTKPIVDGLMEKGLFCDQFGNNLGDRLERTALTYDMCYDAWDTAYRKRVERYMYWAASVVYLDQGKMSRGINWHVCSNWSSPNYTGAAFAGLALWGEKGDKPGHPISPSEADRIAPAVDYTPGPGVPIVPFRDGRSADKWIASTPIDAAVGGDPLSDIGGVERARPEVGTTLEIDDQKVEFKPLDESYTMPEGGINLQRLQTSDTLTVCLYTVLRNDRPRSIKVINPNSILGRPLLVLNGNVLHDGRVVEITEGLYPLLVLIRLQTRWHYIAPRLAEASLDDIEASRDILAYRSAEYAEATKDALFDTAQWTRYGGANISYLHLYEMSRRMMYYYCRDAVGTGGEQAEIAHYGGIASSGPLRYCTAYRQMFGTDVSPFPDITMQLPRKMFQHVYQPDGKDLAQEINSEPEIWTGGWGGHWVAYPIVPKAMQPAVLWAWNRATGFTDAEHFGKLADANPVWTFLYYPLDQQAKAPKECMPLTWQAPDFGFYGFRNSWEGKDDVVVTTFLKQHMIGGWNGPNAGTFRITGLGQEWTHPVTSRERMRWDEYVVQFPDTETQMNLGAGARRTYLKTEKDGSGSLTMDMTDLYSATQGRGGPPLYEAYGNIRHPEALKDIGITGLRALAVDYSGKSGAPALIVLVDQINGGKNKLWYWPLAKPENGSNSDLANTKVEGNTFTITRGDCSLKATFVPTGKLHLWAGTAEKSFFSRGSTKNRNIPAVLGEGVDNFYVIITLQRGAAPEVKIDGEGLAARITVGERTVTFDGAEVTFGDAG